MTEPQGPGIRIDFTINDQAQNYPTHTFEVSATDDELAELAQSGFLMRRGLIDHNLAAALAEALREIADTEVVSQDAEYLPNTNIYIRSVLDKNEIFHSLLKFDPALSIARSMLGPQVYIDLEARMTFPNVSDYAVPWHIHMPVIPHPVPPLFCYPHQIHCLIYLDPITDLEGPLCILPGSHLRTDLRIPLGDHSDLDGQLNVYFEPGDAIFIHGNLWHRTLPTKPSAGVRRLLLLGYVPSWLKGGETEKGVRPTHRLTEQLRKNGDQETRELLGDFQW